MIDSEWYPADFDAKQRLALDAAAEIEDTQDIAELTSYVEAIRYGDYELLPDVENDYDLGYAHLDETGLCDDLEEFFDWKSFGHWINRDRGGEFTSYGWVCFF